MSLGSVYNMCMCVLTVYVIPTKHYNEVGLHYMCVKHINLCL